MNLPQLNISDAVLDEVLQCLGRGNKIEAVKILRAAAGISLMEAKQLADRLEAEKLSTLPSAAAGDSGEDWRIAGKQLLQAGKKLAAIRLCQQQTGSSLQLAKEKVEELAAREGIADKSIGCLPALFALLLAVVIGGLVWFVSR